MTGGRLTSSLLLQPWPRIWFEEIDSTNAEAARRVQAGDIGPVWIAARRQTKGRGRRGRSWVSEPGNLFATALFPLDDTPANAALICFVTCIAVRNAISDIGYKTNDISYKWPNDLMHRGRKISGILIETVQASPGLLAMSVGLGVNIVSAPLLEQSTTSLAELTLDSSKDISADILLERVSDRFSSELDDMIRLGFSEIRRRWLKHAGGLNREVQVRIGNEVVSGNFKDLDLDGSMVLGTASGGQRRITAGDVQLLKE